MSDDDESVIDIDEESSNDFVTDKFDACTPHTPSRSARKRSTKKAVCKHDTYPWSDSDVSIVELTEEIYVSSSTTSKVRSLHPIPDFRKRVIPL